MRIPLLTSLGEDKDYLNNAVILKSPRGLTKSTFILDTGSPKTILNHFDARRLQIPFNSGAKTEIIRLGGKTYQGYTFERITFSFRSEDNQLVREEFPVIVVRPTSPKEEEELSNFPTIIGTDFLKKKRYILFCDMEKGIAYLEKKEEQKDHQTTPNSTCKY
jgi:hypothetical protein